MIRPTKTKRVCGMCGGERCQVSAWIAANTGEVEDAVDGPVAYGYCPSCDHEVELDDVVLTDEERAPILREWNRRGLAAVEAMIVEAMDVLSVETASHLVANATTAMLAFPDDEELVEIHQALGDRIDADRGNRETHPDYPYAYPDGTGPLVGRLAAIWYRAHQGLAVTPDALDRLRDRQESGSAFRGPAFERSNAIAEKRGEVGPRSTLGMTVSRAHGFWTVGFEAPVGRRIAKGEHPMLAVAAELCWRALVRE